MVNFESSDNKRVSDRRRALLGAQIIIENRSIIDCQVRNISESGCQLIVESQIGVPDTFSLRLSNNQKHECSVAWRSQNKIGVAFQDA
ncbi:MAG: PilZ domain-containing protein [Pseudomonadota bacterium]